MDKENKGYIYILTNPSYEEYVKIGYAQDVKKRVKQLNSSEAVPYSFRIYATYEVKSNLSDKSIHRIIDQLNPELRTIEKVDGKTRKREFYQMSAKDAYNILDAIAEISGNKDKLIQYKPTKEEAKEQKDAKKVAENHKERAKPINLKKLGINPGEKLTFINSNSKNTGVECTVIDERRVEYDGVTYSLTALAKYLSDTKSTICGTVYFKYKNEWLNSIRKTVADNNDKQ